MKNKKDDSVKEVEKEQDDLNNLSVNLKMKKYILPLPIPLSFLHTLENIILPFSKQIIRLKQYQKQQQKQQQQLQPQLQSQQQLQQ